MRLHRAWHWWWANTWAALGWQRRAAAHLDAWFVLVATELELHVLYPNDIRDGCQLRRIA